MSRLTWTQKHSFGGPTYIGTLGQLACAYIASYTGTADRFTVEITLGGRDRDKHLTFVGLDVAKEEAERRVTEVLRLAELLND